MQNHVRTELAIGDLQRHLMVLGYRLGREAEEGRYGEKTASALASFKVSMGLGADGVLDQATWTALKDASMQMGDRPLYLHMPFFRGRDVGELQAALSSLGFMCAMDNMFSPDTEYALRSFQENMGLAPTGMLTEESLTAILHLRHAWEGKRGIFIEGHVPASVRSVETLERTPVCVFGLNEFTRGVANRVANLALATTPDSQIVSASSLAVAPGSEMLLVALELAAAPEESFQRSKAQRAARQESQENPAAFADVPVVVMGEGESLAVQCAYAVSTLQEGNNRLAILLNVHDKEAAEASPTHSQEIALAILDALVTALS